MEKKKFISLSMSYLLIVYVIAFSYLVSAADPAAEGFDPQKIIDSLGSVKADGLDSAVQANLSKLSNDQINQLLNTARDEKNLKDKNVVSSRILKESIKKLAGKELNIDLSSDAKIDSLSITTDENTKKSTLNTKINNQDFKIPLNDLPKEVTGIKISNNGVTYQLGKEGKQYIELNNPKMNLIEENGELFVTSYTGADNKEHKFKVSFSDTGWVKFKDGGFIEFSGGAVVYDPETKTTFSLSDTKGKTGLVAFYEKGYIVKSIGNMIVAKKENEGLNIKINKNSDKGVFLLSENGLTQESASYPSGFTKDDSLLIDPEGKKIFVPANKEAYGKIEGTGYDLIGVPPTPQGGTKLDGSTYFGNGGNIFGNGSIPPGGPGGGDKGGGDGGGSDGGGFGGINKMLPWILIIGGVVIAVMLLSSMGKKDKDKDNNNGDSSSNDSKESSNTGDFDYNKEEKVSTGKSDTVSVQSPYTKK